MHVSIVDALVPVGAVIVIGWLCGRYSIINNAHKDSFAAYVINISFPCLLFVVTATSKVSTLFSPTVILAFFCSLMAMYAVGFCLYRFLIQYNTRESGQSAFVCAFPDMAFMGIPILASLLGSKSVIAVAIGNIVSSVVMIPLTIALLERTGGNGSRNMWVDQAFRTIRKPLVIAPIMGIAYSFTGWHLPTFVNDTLMLVGKTTAGVSLFTLGLIISSYKITLSRHVALNIVLKNILHPLVAWGFVVVFGVSGVFAKEIIILCAMPTATMTTMFALRYETLTAETTSSAILGTIAALVTLPVVLYALGI